MKMYSFVLFVLAFIFGLFNINVSSVSANNCASGELFNSVTGQRCGTTPTIVGCVTGYLFSPVTGQSCGSSSVNTSSLIHIQNLTVGSKGDGVKVIQQTLKDKGYSPGVIDGVYGSKTAKAVENFQSDHGLGVTGNVDASTNAKLSTNPANAANASAANIAAANAAAAAAATAAANAAAIAAANANANTTNTSTNTVADATARAAARAANVAADIAARAAAEAAAPHLRAADLSANNPTDPAVAIAYEANLVANNLSKLDSYGDRVAPHSPQVKFGNNGIKLVPRCAPNQYYNSYSAYSLYSSSSMGVGDDMNRTQETCITSPTPTTAQVDDKLNLTSAIAGVSSDPYCPPITRNNSGTVDANHPATSQVYNISCINGEASRIANYVNPWQSLDNLFGQFRGYVYTSNYVSIVPFNSISTGNSAKIYSSNLCKDPVSLKTAYDLNQSGADQGKPVDYMSNSLLLVGSVAATPLHLSQIEWDLTIYIGKHPNYFWDGSMTTDGEISHGIIRYDPAIRLPEKLPPANDWTNPGFKALFHNYQLSPDYLMKCLDNNYVSNFPEWSSHFTSAMSSARAKGLVD